MEGDGERTPCWASGMPRPAGGGPCGPGAVFGVAMCVCVCVLAGQGRGMCSDPACGCRGCRTVRTSCVASAWTRCGTSRRPSGSSASCPTAATPTAWAACALGGRAEGTSRPVSLSKGLGETSVEWGEGPMEGWACDNSSFTFHSPRPLSAHLTGPVPSAGSIPATSSPADSG